MLRCIWEKIISSLRVAVTQVLSSHLCWASVQVLSECSSTTSLEAAMLLSAPLAAVTVALLTPQGTLFLLSHSPVVNPSSWAAHKHVSSVKINQMAPHLLSHLHPHCLTTVAWYSSTHAVSGWIAVSLYGSLAISVNHEKQLLLFNSVWGIQTCICHFPVVLH